MVAAVLDRGFPGAPGIKIPPLSPQMLSLLTLSSSMHSYMQLFFREGFNCLVNGCPGAPGHVGDFLSSYLSNIVRFVFQNCFVFMPCQVIMRKTNFPARRVCKCCKFKHICTLLHVWSSITTMFYRFRTECVRSRRLDLCPWYGFCGLLA